jgi:LysR family glycine cleavage system transcriptional activator
MPDLPPLNALRTFEVAARTGSFVQAGAELGVTSAAVSQQVRLLEHHLDKRLFVRQGNRLTLTDAGRAIYPRLEQAFGDLAALTAQIRKTPSRKRLVVSALPSLAELWLVPHLRGAPVEVGIDIRVNDDPVSFARDGIDLRLTYGAELYPDHHVQTLFSDRIVPVAAPGICPPGGLAALPDSALVHTDWGPSFVTQPSWAAWMARARMDRLPDPAAGLWVGQTNLAVIAAREGLGVALVPSRLAERDIVAGRLQIVDDRALPMASDYVLIRPHALGRRTALRDLVAHLMATA